MVERINLLLKAKNITARQFAEEIGIQPSGMSHILSGRNNPSLDFVMKVVRRWPEVNINWLMFGKGEMFAGVPLGVVPESSTVAKEVDSQSSDEFDLFSQPSVSESPIEQKSSDNIVDVNESKPKVRVSEASALPNVETAPAPIAETPVAPKTQLNENRIFDTPSNPGLVQPNLADIAISTPKQKRIAKIVVLYDDHSFCEYFPE